MRRDFMALPSFIQFHDFFCVDGKPLIRIYDDTEKAAVRLRDGKIIVNDWKVSTLDDGSETYVD